MLKFKGKASNNITLFLLKGELIDSGVWKEMNVKTGFDFILCAAVVPRE